MPSCDATVAVDQLEAYLATCRAPALVPRVYGALPGTEFKNHSLHVQNSVQVFLGPI
jgi:hypothetical protein